MMRKHPINWIRLFEESHPQPGATEAEVVELVQSVAKPLAAAEVKQINSTQRNPFPASDPLHQSYTPFDPTLWKLPRLPLPHIYLAFLQWSNGGSFRNGVRWFDPFFSTTKLREYLIAYAVPQFMPDALPFAFDGGGHFYLFDMRKAPANGEYPIVYCGAGNLGWDDTVIVALDFLTACEG